VTVKKATEDVYGLHVNIRQTSRGPYRLTVLSKHLFNELLDFRNDYQNVLRQDRYFKIGFLRGIFDAEGTVHFNRYQIRIASKNLNLIKVTETLLNEFKIKTGKIHKDKTVYVLPLYGKDNLSLFSEIINFRHEEKRTRLSKLVPV
jgi:DNA-binding transcriptional regulator WhiA